MGKASESHGALSQGIHVVLELVEDGQRLEFEVGPGTERKKVRFEIGHVHGYGELYVERFQPLNANDELDLRVKLIVPNGAGDRPAAFEPIAAADRKHLDKLHAKQLKKAAALPKAEDGAAFNTPTDLMNEIAKDSPTGVDVVKHLATDESLSAFVPGAPTPEEIMGITTVKVEDPGAEATGPQLGVVSAERQFTSPKVDEEDELHKMAHNAMPVVTNLPEPSPEDAAERANTAAPTPGEEKTLDAKQRGRRGGNPALGGRLR